MTDISEKINDDITLYQNPGSLAFGTDAYLLSAYIRRQPKEKACELGAGSGVISLLLSARGKFSHITAIEIQAPIAEIAVRNVEKNGFSDKIDVICADIRRRNASLSGAFGAVFANPPYLPTGCGKHSENEADAASRHEIHGDITDFAAAAADYLKFGGVFYAVYRQAHGAYLRLPEKPSRTQAHDPRLSDRGTYALSCASGGKKARRAGTFSDKTAYDIPRGTGTEK